MEVLAGARDDQHADELRRLLYRCTLLHASGLQTFEHASAIYRECRQAGQTVASLVDCRIAAICIENDAKVFAVDRDYETIAKHTSLESLLVLARDQVKTDRLDVVPATCPHVIKSMRCVRAPIMRSYATHDNKDYVGLHARLRGYRGPVPVSSQATVVGLLIQRRLRSCFHAKGGAPLQSVPLAGQLCRGPPGGRRGQPKVVPWGRRY